jgi:hypothetical protein
MKRRLRSSIALDLNRVVVPAPRWLPAQLPFPCFRSCRDELGAITERRPRSILLRVWRDAVLIDGRQICPAVRGCAGVSCMDEHPPHPDLEASQPPPPSSTATNADGWAALGHVNEWIRFADTKAAGTLAGAAFAGGALINYFSDTEPGGHALLVNALGWAVGASTLASAIFCLLCLVPRTELGARHLYFRRIAEFPSAKRYQGELRGLLTRDGLFGELSEELWARARVADKKYRFVTWGLSCFAATLVLGAVLGISVVTS